MWLKAGKLKWTLLLSTVGLLGAAAIAYFTFARSTPNINLEKDTVLVQAEDLQMQIKANGVVQPVQKLTSVRKKLGKL